MPFRQRSEHIQQATSVSTCFLCAIVRYFESAQERKSKNFLGFSSPSAKWIQNKRFVVSSYSSVRLLYIVSFTEIVHPVTKWVWNWEVSWNSCIEVKTLKKQSTTLCDISSMASMFMFKILVSENSTICMHLFNT